VLPQFRALQTPDLARAEAHARKALALVPSWHYVRDILLRQIEAARRTTTRDQPGSPGTQAVARGLLQPPGMELWLTLRFRGAPLGLRDRFPPELAFVARQLRSLDGPEVPPSERISTAYVQVTPEQAEAILAWGRTRAVDGRSLLASASFEERWRAHELVGTAVVELARPPAVEALPVLGRGRSHLARWACSHCERLRWEQVGPLELVLEEPADVELLHRARPELLLTDGGELVVSSRLRPVLEAHRLGTRPVLGTQSWLQVEIEESVPLAAVPPLESQGSMCRGCGREPVARAEGRRHSRVGCASFGPLLDRGRSAATRRRPGLVEQRLGFTGAVHDRPEHPMVRPLTSTCTRGSSLPRAPRSSSPARHWPVRSPRHRREGSR
jgi:hypothetical protein